MVPPMSDAPSKTLTIEEQAAAKAESIMQDSAFATVEDRKKWIATALVEFYKSGSRTEHDMIERFIGTRTFQQVREMVERCKFKYRMEREMILKGKKRLL